MVKPVLTPMSPLPALDLQGYDHYLPTAFNESLTLLQKLNKMLVYINEIHGLSAEIVTQWNEVMDWILNDGLTESVMVEFQKRVDDGTFDNIINDELLLGKPDITVSATEPAQKNLNTFWYKVV